MTVVFPSTGTSLEGPLRSVRMSPPPSVSVFCFVSLSTGSKEFPPSVPLRREQPKSDPVSEVYFCVGVTESEKVKVLFRYQPQSSCRSIPGVRVFGPPSLPDPPRLRRDPCPRRPREVRREALEVTLRRLGKRKETVDIRRRQ